MRVLNFLFNVWAESEAWASPRVGGRRGVTGVAVMAASVQFGLACVINRADTEKIKTSSSEKAPHRIPPSPDDQPSHDAAGVDLMQVRDALAMTPAERLKALTEMMASIAQLGRIT